jgi:cytochrome c-type biogenesis protein CcmH/NrfG
MAPGARPKKGWEAREKALSEAQAWTKAEPENELAWDNLGFAYLVTGRYRKAVEAFREVLRLMPDNAEAWKNLA